MSEELPALEMWQKIVGEIMDRTTLFPRSARFTFASRIDSLALDVLDDLVLARYSARPEKAGYLRHADLCVSRLLVFIRLSNDRRFIGAPGYGHLSRRLIEFGKIIGGWRKSV